MTVRPDQTALWGDAVGAPAVLERFLAEREGVDDAAAALSRPRVRRLVVTGNGAAYYVGLALWAASLAGPGDGPEVVAVPAGLVARGRFRWRTGDAGLVISSSGELRDAIEAVDAGVPRPLTVITATPGSTLGAAADERVVVPVARQESDTHTQAYLGNVLAALALWAGATGDAGLDAALAAAPQATWDGLDRGCSWAAGATAGLTAPPAAIAFGPGTAWPAAMEAALLCKEVAGVPTEGMEAREGATSGMYALAPGHLVLSLGTRPDDLQDEAERICRATGATLLRVPGGDTADPRLAAITTFPAALALALHLAALRGVDPDHPSWSAAYHATARAQGDTAT